ncbi:poly-specific ribonuclease parn-like [Stylonychia lemnae]|uniref:Poly-specific ribonuclease parn-like n=1 Tax=Stylonychia lemnae TaxID=5949 RepID=A0A078A223_STYLE|nr:poly-specific ribonuclease parn-like [Stylonychia lemnae]|eukprot:CDW76281.1 poly-specific ribonuclease parn-like [Stylonychia lemnae]
MGICGFKYIEESQKLECFPFNFYITPQNYDMMQINRKYLINTGSFEFLADNKFDFNKFFYESVGYVSNEQDKIQKSHLNTKGKSDEFYRLSLKNIDQKKTVFLIYNLLRLQTTKEFYLNLDTQNLEMFLTHSQQQDSIYKVKNEENIIQMRINYFIETQRQFQSGKSSAQNGLNYLNGKTYDQWVELENKHRELTSLNIDNLFNDAELIDQMFKDDFNNQSLLEFLSLKSINTIPNKSSESQDRLGFTRVINLMRDLQKPVISHNGIMDLMFLIEKFDKPLPDNIQDFKLRLNSFLPQICDTKHMINSRLDLQNMFPAGSLSDVYQEISSNQERWKYDQTIEINENFDEYKLTGDVYHDAGFDALMTGIVWLKLMTRTHGQNKFMGLNLIMENDNFKLMDLNKIPMASIRASLNLTTSSEVEQQIKEKSVQSESTINNYLTDEKPFLYFLDKLPQRIQVEDLTVLFREKFGVEVKVYRAFNKNYALICDYSLDNDKKMQRLFFNSDNLLEREEIFVTLEDKKSNNDGDSSQIQLRLVMYDKYQKELKERIDMLYKPNLQMPDHMWIINQ